MPTDNKNTPTEEQPSWLSKIVVLPKFIGELIFTILAKDDASEVSKFILGYMILAGVILIILGIVFPETLKALINYLYK